MRPFRRTISLLPRKTRYTKRENIQCTEEFEFLIHVSVKSFHVFVLSREICHQLNNSVVDSLSRGQEQLFFYGNRRLTMVFAEPCNCTGPYITTCKNSTTSVNQCHNRHDSPTVLVPLTDYPALSGVILRLSTSVTPRNRVLEKPIVPHLVKKFPALYGTQIPLPCPQQMTTCRYPEPHQSSPPA